MSKMFTMDCFIFDYYKRSKKSLEKGETAEFIFDDSRNWSVKIDVSEYKQNNEILATVCRISTKLGFCHPKPRVVCYRYTQGYQLKLKDMKFQGPLQQWTTLLVTDQFQQIEEITHREDLRLIFELYLDTNATSEYKMFVNLVTDIGGHLMNPTFSDVTIRTSEGDELPAHMILLVARSSVFSALFQHDTAEKATNTVECPFPTNVVKHLLAFIYQDKAADIEETALDLLVTADYYHLDPLKELCEDVLKKKLNVNNAIELLKLADTHNAYHLKKRALEFIKIKKNAVEIVKRNDWDSLSKELVQSIFKFTLSD